MRNVVARAQSTTVLDGQAVMDFVMVSPAGNAASVQGETLSALSGTEDAVEIYALIEELVCEHNDEHKGDMRIAGLVHLFRTDFRSGIEDEEDDEMEVEPDVPGDCLVVVALDETRSIEMALLPIADDGAVGEPIYGSGGSPFLDPWGAFRSDAEA